jgi:hypothetical protein
MPGQKVIHKSVHTLLSAEVLHGRTHAVQPAPGAYFESPLLFEYHEPMVCLELVHAADVASNGLPNHLCDLAQQPIKTCPLILPAIELGGETQKGGGK